MKNNIDLFDEYTTKILAKLYESFPNPIDLDVFELAGYYTDDPTSLPPYHVLYKKRECVIATIEYLIRNNDMMTDGQDDDTYQSCVLTAKGLTALNEKSSYSTETIKVTIAHTKTSKTAKTLLTNSAKLTKAVLKIIFSWYLTLVLNFYLIVLPMMYFIGWIRISYVA